MTIDGPKSSAIIYSIAETAKGNNLKSYNNFEHLLTEIPKHLDEKDLSSLDAMPHGPSSSQSNVKNETINFQPPEMVVFFMLVLNILSKVSLGQHLYLILTTRTDFFHLLST